MNLEKSFFAYIQNRRKYMLQQKLGLLISLSPKIFILITSCATTVVSGSLITFLSPNFHFFPEKKRMEAVISSPMAQSGTVVALVTATLTIGGSFSNASFM
jgi:hypothetical protein